MSIELFLAGEEVMDLDLLRVFCILVRV